MGTAERTLGTNNSAIPSEDPLNVIKDLPADGNDVHPFNLRPVTYHEVLQVLRALRLDCSTGPDLIPARFIKMAASVIASPLTNIINNSISKSMFPRIWKVGRVSPIPKVDSPTEESHFRPVSVLPVLSNVIEKLVGLQIVDYIEFNQSLKQSIAGFRKGHSTATVLLRIRDDIIRAMKKGELTLMVLADYSKAFDTVSYSVVIKKMYRLGFSRSFLYWMTNYLSDRLQYVQVDDNKSLLEHLHFGVPQGSILGPLLFNIYTADLQDNLSNSISCYQYADDTTLYKQCTVKDLAQNVADFNSSLSHMASWSLKSNLALNPVKTKSMLLLTRQMASFHGLKDENLNLEISNRQLERVIETRLLGVKFQENLKWNDLVKDIANASYVVLRALRKLKHFTDFHLRKRLADSLVLSRLDYCDSVYSPLPGYLLKRLHKIEFAAVSFVYGRYVNDIGDILKLNWLPVKERRDFNLLKLTFKALNAKQWPSYLNLQRVSIRRGLRSSDSIRLQVPLEKGTFQDTAAALFNNLPDNLKKCDDFILFSSRIFKFLKNREQASLS